jgi:histidine triad (HIT) family protein
LASIFTKIINGDIPCHKLHEDENFFSFLDINPIREGHALVIPKKEIDYIFDLDDQTLGGLHVFAKKVAKAIQEVVLCKRIGTTVLGLEVPHAHLHLVPIDDINGINFRLSKPAEHSHLAILAEKIRANIES